MRRRIKRVHVFERARARARALGRPLVVVGAPDSGPTGGYPCGDVTVDIGQSACPVFVRADITQRLPFDDDSCVIFCSCVLEYVSDFSAASRELVRIAGEPDNVFLVCVEPWTLTGFFYPGAKRIVTELRP